MGFAGSDRYLASQALKMAVDAAIVLEKPLLIKGEPGTGKTVPVMRDSGRFLQIP
jgi:MoxR-like ATPase